MSGFVGVGGPRARGKWTPDAIRESMLLYAVTDSAWLDGRTLASYVKEAVAGGATFVQLREKGMSTGELVAAAKPIASICRAAGVPFVIDDDVEAARLSGADGVHVGQSDTACAAARAALGEDAIVGVSAETVEQALAAQDAGADYLGVGAMIATPTKPDADVVPMDELQRICEAVSIPVVAIGGINASTIDAFAGSGIDGVAVVSAIFASNDPRASAADLVRKARSVRK